MADEIDVLRDFRADIAEPDADRLERIADTIAARTRPTTSARPSTPANDSDIPLLPLDADETEPQVRVGERGRRAVAGVVAAAAVLVVGAIALSLLNDDESPVASGGEALPPLIADHPPEGLHLVEAHRYTTTVEPIASRYVPAGQDDPFAGPLINISGVGPEYEREIRPIDPRDPFPDEVMEVDGHTVAVDRFDEMVSARWLGDDTFHFLLARGITDDELRAAIGGARLNDDERNVIDADALPDGWVEFEPSSPSRARHPDSRGSLIYAAEAAETPQSRTLIVHWVPGDATDLEWKRLRIDEDAIGCAGAGEDEACPDVSGSSVVLGSLRSSSLDNPSIVMAWVHDGRFVQVTSLGVSVGELYVFAESLRPTTWEALEDAVDST